MADLAFGLAKSAVVGTLTVVKSAIEEDKKLQERVKCDLMLVSDEFEMMNAFLNVAMEGEADDMVKTLVRQVREMALNVEDCIEFAVQLDKGSYWWRRWLPRCVPAAAPAAALDDVVAKIELLKSRIESVGHRNMRYGHIRGSKSKSIVQIQQVAEGNTTTSDILPIIRLAAEKHRIPCDLVNFITEKYGTLPHHVIPLLGTGNDVGMTSIIKEAFENPNICQHFGFRAWVKVKDPSNPLEFLQSLLLQFHTNFCRQHGSTMDVLKKIEALKSEGGLIEKLMEQFCDQRYLVVLEDISSMVDWDTISVYLPDRNKGCCIIVHTQQFEIASWCAGNSYRILEQKGFSSSDSTFVFIKEDGENDKGIPKQTDARNWLDHFQLIGRELDLKILGDAISSSTVEVFAVLGIAGVGKSSLVKHLYYTEVKHQSFAKFGWVNVCHPFNLREFSWSLLLDLHSNSIQHGRRLRIMDPVQECREFLQSHRCLIVLDGIDSIEEWDMAKSILASSENRVIVITNEESVALSCAKPSGSVWNVKGLKDDEVEQLSTKRVIEKNSSWQVSEEWFVNVVGEIMPRCGGLPKVILATTDFIAARLYVDKQRWKILKYRFMHLLETHSEFTSLHNVVACLHSYLQTCPDFLKSCIFYLSIFDVAEGVFRRRRLLRRWMLEGYSRDKKEIAVEETVDEFFSKLVNLGMIEPVSNSMSVCKVNGFFLEYIISRPPEENHVFALDRGFKGELHPTGRHLVIEPSWYGDDRALFESIDLSRLRSLTVYGGWRSYYISDKMRALQVLDLEDAEGVTDGDLEVIVKLLRRLKFLSLRRCREVYFLPHSTGHLMRQLETLDIRYTSIITLPKSIVKLRNLQYICAGSAPEEASRSRGQFGLMVPKGIGGMFALQTLGVIDGRDGDILEELKNHTRLRKLRVSNISRKNYCKLSSVIECNPLESLSVWFDDDNNQADFLGNERCDAPKSIQCVKLYGLQDTLPGWIRYSWNLSKLSLQMTVLKESDKIALSYLRNLRILTLHIRHFQDGILTFVNGFEGLICLAIIFNSSLHAVKFMTSTMTNLEVVKLRCSRVSSLQFSVLNHLPRLMEVHIRSCSWPVLKAQLQSQLEHHPNKIKLVPSYETPPEDDMMMPSPRFKSSPERRLVTTDYRNCGLRSRTPWTSDLEF